MHRIIKNFYRDLFKKGWTLNQIDESDIFFLFDLFFEEEKQEAITYADQVPWL
jgi:hypothetical protein